MAKDYTDYVAWIGEAEKRVVHIYHFRAKTTDDQTEFIHNKRPFVFDRDRAYRIKWAPWQKWDWKHPLTSINELIRTKRIGLLIYHMPLPSEPLYRDVEHKVPKEFVCKTCGFTTVHARGIKTHMKTRHKVIDYGKHIRVGFDITVEKVPYYPPIQPIHLSRMHQPSGEMRP